MAEGNDVRALEKITTEVNDIQWNILFSTQCIKVQAILVDKLKKQSERQKEVCGFISSANLKLKTEIKLAELEFNSLQEALKTISAANIEYRKELLLVKERRSEIEERVKNGIVKYEELWTASKQKYENIPLIKKYLEAKNKCETLKDNINTLKNEYDHLYLDKQRKIKQIKTLEREHILQIANYFVNERPKSIKIFTEQEHSVKKLKHEIQDLLQECHGCQEATVKQASDGILLEDTKNWPEIQNNSENEGLMIPNIHLQNADLDILSLKLNEIKKGDSFIPKPKNDAPVIEEVFSKDSATNNLNKDDSISNYFNLNVKANLELEEDNNKRNFSEKKLIHIIEDIKLDKKETCNMVAKINQSSLQTIDMIKSVKDDQNDMCQNDYIEDQIFDELEEVNLTTTNAPILPPTQYMDLEDNHYEFSKQSGSALEENNKYKESQESKRVKFDIKEPQDNDTLNTENNNLNASSQSFEQMKEMILKKHNLDLSPQFVFTKNTIQMRPTKDPSASENVTSKFFKQSNDDDKVNETLNAAIDNIVSNNELTESIKKTEIDELPKIQPHCSSPKDQQDMTVAGLLFLHGPQSVPDSLNLSVSTAEYDEGDSDFAHGIDASLLLSPKADIPATNEKNNNENNSQGIPNFLSGIRKAGVSLFGAKSDDTKVNSNSGNSGNNFTFSFGGEEKRARGGLFSMFQ